MPYLIYITISDLHRKTQTGVIAQDVQRVLPDAVTTSTSSAIPFATADGREIKDMLIVNKDRLFLGEWDVISCQNQREKKKK